MRQLENENIIHELRPHRNIIIYWSLRYLLFVAIFFLVFGLPFLNIMKIALSIFVMLIFLLIYFALILLAFFLRKTYVYYITDKRCVFEGGILRRISHSVTYNKITDVEVSQNILERIMGIATLKIQTAGLGGKDKSELEFVGLTDAETPAAEVSKLKQAQETGK